MRILIFGDVHWSTYSSIIRNRGNKYSTRLENLINSLNWIQELSKINKCDEIVCLGDFFDKSELVCEEISALTEVNWNADIPAHFIVGNHESNVASLVYNSTNALNKPNFKIEYKANKYDVDEYADIYFLPYIIEDNRKNLTEYLTDLNPDKKHIIFSHNDIKGVKYGMFESKEGFDLTEIENNCDLFINGHLHNGSFLNDKKTILNLGNLTGQNFSEDAFQYNHRVCILDTQTLKLEFIENPFAFNFYKIEINKKIDLHKLDSLKNNAVISIKCLDTLVPDLKTKLESLNNIAECKTIIYRENIEVSDYQKVELGNKDYLKQFNDFVIDKLGSNEIVIYELGEVCK